jgi:hypothetical protein
MIFSSLPQPISHSLCLKYRLYVTKTRILITFYQLDLVLFSLQRKWNYETAAVVVTDRVWIVQLQSHHPS